MIFSPITLFVFYHRPARLSLRTPYTDCRTHDLAEPLTPKRLTLRQGEPDVCQSITIQFTSKQPGIKAELKN